MKKIILVVFLTCSAILHGQTISEKVVLNSIPNSLKLLSASEDALIVEVQVGNFFKQW